MTETTSKPPVWFWIIAVIAVLWNLMGLYDYVMSMTLNQAYLASFGQEMLDFLKVMPMWAKLSWGLAIAGSVLGSLALVLRKAIAYPLFLLTIVVMVISFGYQFTTDAKPEAELVMWIMTALIWVIAIFLVWFSRMSRNKNWLK